MAKSKTKLILRIPPYQTPRNVWRKRIHWIALLQAKKAEVSYRSTDKLQLMVRLYLKDKTLFFHDLDNRLKDIMDALQGRVGGPKKVRTHPAIIPNDNQIYRVVIEKAVPPKQSKGFGHLAVTKYVRKKNLGTCKKYSGVRSQQSTS